MLFASGDKALGSAQLSWRMAFGGCIWWNVVRRNGLVLDTRWIPGARAQARPRACVYILTKGTLEVLAPTPALLRAPVALELTEAELDGADGLRTFHYRAWGEPFASIQVYVPRTLLLASSSEAATAARAPRPVELSPEGWRYAAAAAAATSAEATLEPMTAVLGALAASRALRPEVTRPETRRTSAAMNLLWRGVRPIIERHYLTPTVEEVSQATGVSVRQVDRYVAEFAEQFAIVGGTRWRLLARHLRLKLAVLWLSADGVSIEDVARATSYGSTDAMSRAFRDAGLPAPSEVRARIRAEGRSAHLA